MKQEKPDTVLSIYSMLPILYVLHLVKNCKKNCKELGLRVAYYCLWISVHSEVLVANKQAIDSQWLPWPLPNSRPGFI